MSGLPKPWTIKLSKSHNREYFYNTDTKQSSWDAPAGTDFDKLKSYLLSNSHNPDQIRCSHILVKHAGSRRPRSWKNEKITISKEDAIAIAKKYQDSIKSGVGTFDDLALNESDCSSHTSRGDLGFFGRGAMQPSFEKAAFALQIGEMSDIVESDSGIHLILRTG